MLRVRASIAPIALLLVTSCGSGSGGLLSLIDGGGGGNGPSVVQNLQVDSTRTDPATISFSLSDPENNSAEVEFAVVTRRFENGAQIDSAPTPLSFVNAPADLAGEQLASLAPGDYTLRWAFSSDLGPGFRRDAVIQVRVGGTLDVEFALNGVNGRPDGIGNDPPAFTTVTETVAGQELRFVDPVLPDFDEANQQVTGKVRYDLEAVDSSSDNLFVFTEFALVDSGDLSVLADPGALTFFGAGDPGDPFMALDELSPAGLLRASGEPAPAASNFTLYWNTDRESTAGRILAGRERFVVLRLTPMDLDDDGMIIRAESPEQSFLTRPVRVDNNSEPIVEIGVEFSLNADSRRGIPIPISIFEREGDDIGIAMQFFDNKSQLSDPTLKLGGKTPDQIRAILADPRLRKQFRIATELPLFFEGPVLPVSDPALQATSFRAEGLAKESSSLLSSGGVVGDEREVEILRDTRIPELWAPTTNPLNGPVAVLPVDDGREALVLDGKSPWRLRRVDLATGAVSASFNAPPAASTPTAMGMTPDGESVLVADHDGSHWSLHRVSLVGEASETVASSRQATTPDIPTAPVRGIIARSEFTAVFSTGNALVQATYLEGLAPRISKGVELNAPHGIVLEPSKPHRAFVAETGADRIVHVDLSSFQYVRVAAVNAALGALQSPTALALEADGARLLALTADGQNLDSITLGRPYDTDRDAADAPDTSYFRVASALGNKDSLATGPCGLRVLVDTGASALSIAGGIEQIRDIRSFDFATQRLGVVSSGADPAFQPALGFDGTPRRWRIRDRIRAIREIAGETVLDVFVWDSADAEAGGRAFVRVTPFDDETGVASTTESEKRVLHRMEVDETILSLDGTPLSQPDHLVALDVDGDGSRELLTANRGEFSGGGSGRENASSGVARFKRDRIPGRYAFDGVVGDELDFRDVRWITPGFMSPNDTVPSIALAAKEEGQLSLIGVDGGGMVEIDSLEASSNCCELGFIDDDELPDLVVSRRGLGVIQVYLQPDGGFVDENGDSAEPDFELRAPQGGSTQLPQAIGCLAVDVNADGRTDIVGTFTSGTFGLNGSDSTNPPALAIFLQDENGGFPVDDPILISTEADAPTPDKDPNLGELWHLFADDLDQNGLMDLALAHRTLDPNDDNTLGSGEVRVAFQLKPLDSGTDAADCFDVNQIPLSGPAVIRPHMVEGADFDQNGLLDLVVGVAQFSGLNIFPQRAAGDFSQNVLVYNDPEERTRGSRGVVAEDVDGDGWADIVVSNQGSDHLSIYLQNRPGVLDRQPARLTDLLLFNPQSAAIADLNADGLPDLATINDVLDNITVFFQFTPGAFNTVPLVLTLPVNVGKSFKETTEADDIRAADVDGDGRTDLVVVVGRPFIEDKAGKGIPPEGDDSFLYVFLQGDGSQTPFSQVIRVTLDQIDADNSRCVDVADLDLDGRLDLVVGNAEGDELEIYTGDGTGNFSFSGTTLGTGNRPTEVHAEDLDRDGRLDLVSVNEGRNPVDLASSEAPSLTLFRQLPGQPGVFGPAESPALGLDIGDSITSATVADLNQDGRPDLAVSVQDRTGGGSQDLDRLLLLFQSADGSFSAPAVLRPSPNHLDGLGVAVEMLRPTMVRAGDIDGDGDLDLAVSCGVVPPDSQDDPAEDNSSNVLVFRQEAPGVFERFPIELKDLEGDEGRRPLFVQLADLNGDGELDLVTGHEGREEILIHFGGR